MTPTLRALLEETVDPLLQFGHLKDELSAARRRKETAEKTLAGHLAREVENPIIKATLERDIQYTRATLAREAELIPVLEAKVAEAAQREDVVAGLAAVDAPIIDSKPSAESTGPGAIASAATAAPTGAIKPSATKKQRAPAASGSTDAAG